MVKELEEQKGTILRNAEKDTRTFERKMEQMRGQMRKLEQRLEDAKSRLLPRDDPASVPEGGAEPPPAGIDQASEQKLEYLRRETEVQGRSGCVRARSHGAVGRGASSVGGIPRAAKRRRRRPRI
jgi:hypothetical protein